MTAEAPLVFAHRGSSAALPEHTPAAFRRAIAEGADGLECDVRLTRDGHLVCIHDAVVDRTSDGRGRVSAATLDELDRLDFFSWHDGARRYWHDSAIWSEPERGILTLDRLITIALEAGRPMRLLVETKHPSRYGSTVEERLVGLLQRRGLLPDGDPDGMRLAVTVMSFSPLAIRRIRALAPSVPTAFLFELAPPAVREGRTPFGATLLGPSVTAVRARADLVKRAHDQGNQVYVWTVNTASDIDLMLELGVDGVISDRPADVLARLGRAC